MRTDTNVIYAKCVSAKKDMHLACIIGTDCSVDERCDNIKSVRDRIFYDLAALKSSENSRASARRINETIAEVAKIASMGIDNARRSTDA